MPANSTESSGASTVFQPMCGTHGRIEQGDRARPLPEPLGLVPALDTVLEQHLHADADAEHRPARDEPLLDDRGAADASSPP